ncbi:MAG: insulinase family protein [Flavobacteriales bacterium]|nr:insulinase family protein [Flavobacteriales bacterium]
MSTSQTNSRRLASLKGICAATGLFLPFLMNAQIDRTLPPVPAPAPIVNIGEHKTFTLPNGLRVIVVENHKLPMVGVQLRFDIPPMSQGNQVGFVEMMGDLLTHGAGNRSKAQIDQDVDRLGAQLSANSEGVYASVLKKHLEALLPIMADVATAPTFPSDELAKAKKRTLSEVQQRKDDPSAIGEAVGRSVTYGRSHPYGEVATERSIAQVNEQQLKAYHAKFFRPEKGYLVFVGDITEKEAKALAKARFGDWKPAQKYTVVDEDGKQTIEGIGEVRFLEKPAIPRGPRRVIIVDRPGAAQSVIRVGFPLNLQPKDVRALSAQVMNTILGGGVFNAQLMQNLREDKGWTYGSHATLDADRFNGHFHTSANVRTAVTDSAIAETIKEIERMRTTRVSPEELDLAKRFMAGSFARSLEDPRTIARFALNTYLNELPKDHYATYLKRLEAVTAEDVQAAAEAFLHPDNAVILVVGDKRKLLHRLEPLSWATNPVVTELDHNGEFFVEQFEPVRDRTAQQVLDAHIAAIGGREAIGRIKDMRMQLSTEMKDMPLEIVQWYGPDGLFRSTVKSNGSVMREEAYDGQRAMRSDSQGVVELEDADLGDLQFNGHPVPEVRYGPNVERMVLAGRTTVDGKPVYKVHIVLATGGSAGDYFEISSGLKLRRVEQRSVDGRAVTIITDYSDYQPAGGVLFPRMITQTGGPAGELVMKVEAIDLNTGLKPAFFATNLPERKVEEYIEPEEENPLEPTPDGVKDE